MDEHKTDSIVVDVPVFPNVNQGRSVACLHGKIAIPYTTNIT